MYSVYLAGPMDGVSSDDAGEWREKLASEFPDVLFYMPNTAYRNANRYNAVVMDGLNRHAINQCTGMIANLLGPGRAFGTIREVEYARLRSKRVVVVAHPKDVGEHTLMTYDLGLELTPTAAMENLLTYWADKIAEMHQMPTLFQILGGEMEPPTDE